MMKLASSYVIALGIILSVNNTAKAACVECGPDTYSADGASTCTPCPENAESPRGSTSQSACTCKTGYKTTGSGTTLACSCPTAAAGATGPCKAADDYVVESRFDATKGSCVVGDITAGVYVVNLVGGTGGTGGGGNQDDNNPGLVKMPGAAGSHLTFRFIVTSTVAAAYPKYRLCAGGNGANADRSDEGGGGGAGSWLEIGTGTTATDFTGKYFFVAGGGGGGSGDSRYCNGIGGGGGGGAGGGGSSGDGKDSVDANDGGSAGPYNGGKVGRNCTVGVQDTAQSSDNNKKWVGGGGCGIKNDGKMGNQKTKGDANGSGSGGGNGGKSGSSTCQLAPGVFGNISSFDIIDAEGTPGTTSVQFGGDGGGFAGDSAEQTKDDNTYRVFPTAGNTSHTSNETGLEFTNGTSTLLWKLKPPA